MGGTEAYQLKRRARCETERKRVADGARDEAGTPDGTSSAGRGTEARKLKRGTDGRSGGGAPPGAALR